MAHAASFVRMRDGLVMSIAEGTRKGCTVAASAASPGPLRGEGPGTADFGFSGSLFCLTATPLLSNGQGWGAGLQKDGAWC